MPRDISKHVRAHALWQVNRSNAFEISWNPWKHTDRAVFGYRLLQRCGFRPGSARNNKSARSPRAMSHNPASDICLPTRSEGIHAPSRGYNALVLRKDAWAAVFPGKIVLRSTRVHTTTMQVPMEDCRHVCDLHRRHRTADGSWPPRAPIAPFCLRMGKICTAAVHQGSRGSFSPCWLVGAPGLRS